MKSFKYQIMDDEGVHARPAGVVVNEAKKYQSEIKLRVNGKEADCKRIFGVMGLGIKKGQEVEFVANGEDEDLAIKAIEEVVKNNL